MIKNKNGPNQQQKSSMQKIPGLLELIKIYTDQITKIYNFLKDLIIKNIDILICQVDTMMYIIYLKII